MVVGWGRVVAWAVGAEIGVGVVGDKVAGWKVWFIHRPDDVDGWRGGALVVGGVEKGDEFA